MMINIALLADYSQRYIRIRNCGTQWTTLSSKKSRTSSDSIEETRLYHERYLRAMNSPVRRRILRVLKEGDYTVEELARTTGLDAEALKWHMNILEHGFCVEKENKEGRLVYKLTQEGKVVDYME